MTYLKKTHSEWFSPALYGLLAASIFAFGSYSFMRLITLPKYVPPITVDNVERNLRLWLDNSSLSVQKGDDPTNAAYFSLLTRLPNSDPITISRLKARDNYIAIQATITISPEHKVVLDKLPKEELDALEAQLGLELARVNMGYLESHPLNQIVLVSRLPIGPGLTEFEFMSRLDEMDSSLVIVRNTVLLKISEIQRRKKHETA